MPRVPLHQTSENFDEQASHFMAASDALIITFLKHDSKILESQAEHSRAQHSTAVVLHLQHNEVQLSFVLEFLRICAAVHYY